MFFYNNNVIERIDMWEFIRMFLLLFFFQRVIKIIFLVLDIYLFIVIVLVGILGYNEYWGGF